MTNLTQTNEQKQRAAKNLLDNPDYLMLYRTRMQDLVRDTMESSDDKEILAAHAEYRALEDFHNWLLTQSEGRT